MYGLPNGTYIRDVSHIVAIGKLETKGEGSSFAVYLNGQSVPLIVEHKSYHNGEKDYEKLLNDWRSKDVTI